MWFGTLAFLSVLLAGVFVAQGAWLVLPFTCVELLALGAAFLVYARHAGDFERIQLGGGRIVVERWTAGRLERQEVGPDWVRFEYEGGRQGLICLVAGQTRLEIGRFLPEEGRKRLVRELRAALAERRA